MAQRFPRVITRGPLKGISVGSEAEYRRAYALRTGITRHAQRTARARALGFSSVYAQRSAKAREKGFKSESHRRRTRRQIGQVAGRLKEGFYERDKDLRLEMLIDLADEFDIEPYEFFALFYAKLET